MKELKVSTFKSLVNVSLVFVLFTSACAQSGDKSTAEATKKVETNANLVEPAMNIQMAVISGNLEVVNQHIDAGTDINLKDQMSGSSPLITAATFNQKEIAKALIDAGADLSVKNNDGATALHVAAFFCRVEIAQFLIDAKADKNVKNNFGATPGESVSGPYAEIKPIYEMLQQQLSPFGLKLDLDEIEKLRPVIAKMLQ